MGDNSKIIINTIVFDYDGTLCEFQIPFRKMRKEIIEYLTPILKSPKNFLSMEDRISITGKKARKFLIENNRLAEWSKIKMEIEEISKRWEWKAARSNEIYPNIPNLLNFLKNNNIKLGIFTLEPKEIIMYLLEKNEILSYFQSIVARDDVLYPKPNSEHLLKVLNTLQSNPKYTLVVGDHPVDIECANNIGAKSMAVLTKRHQIEDFDGYDVDFFVNDISELKNLFEEQIIIKEK
ncbi:MAG: HAD family hydrolase [Candidatus Helarchaeota archaeon]